MWRIVEPESLLFETFIDIVPRFEFISNVCWAIDFIASLAVLCILKC